MPAPGEITLTEPVVDFQEQDTGEVSAKLRSSRPASKPAQAPRVTSDVVSDISTQKSQKPSRSRTQSSPTTSSLSSRTSSKALEAALASSTPTPSPSKSEDHPVPNVPPNVLAAYRTPLHHSFTHGIPVAQLQLRSYSARNLEFFADFCIRAAYYLSLPCSGAVPLPKKIERWTVLKSNFINKKAQENFERITMKRLVTVYDGAPEVVETWLAFVRRWQFYGVGMKAHVWGWESLGKFPHVPIFHIYDALLFPLGLFANRISSSPQTYHPKWMPTSPTWRKTSTTNCVCSALTSTSRRTGIYWVC